MAAGTDADHTPQTDEPTPDREHEEREQRPDRPKGMGSVVYLDGEALKRPLYPPRTVIMRGLAIAAVAAVIGGAVLFSYLDGMINGPAREQALVEEYISQPVDRGLPELVGLVSLDDAAITAQLEGTGATLFERPRADSTKPFELIKLPPDVSAADAAALYLKGVSSLSAPAAVRLLNGSWDLTVNRENGLNLGLHYADFDAGTLERAVGNAARSQGFDTEGDVESGVDSSGNTYISGAVDADGQTYSWKVSAVPLSEMYSQKGLPEDAAYVGIRLYR